MTNGPVLSDRLADGATLEQHQLDAAVAGDELEIAVGHDGGPGVGVDRVGVADRTVEPSKA